MSNTLIPTRVLSGSAVANEILLGLENNLVMTKHVRRDFDKNYAVSGAKIGTVLNIKLPVRYTGTRGVRLQVQDSEERTTALRLDTRYQQAVSFSTEDLTMTVDNFRTRFLDEAIAQMANEIDSDLCNLYWDFYNCVGTPQAVPTGLTTYLDAGVKMSNEGVAKDKSWAIVLGPAAEAAIVNAYTGIFNPQSEISAQYLNGTMGRAVGFKWSMDQNVIAHTVGAQGGTPAIATTPSEGDSSLATSGWTSAASNRLKRGDVFTIGSAGAGTAIYRVNPKSRRSTGQLAQFTVTADFDSAADGTGTLAFSPALEASGPYQNISALPASGALLNVLGTGGYVSPQALAFQKDAIAFGCADLMLPQGVHFNGRASDPDVGISVRIVQQYTIVEDEMPCRMDVLGGRKVLDAARGCRIAC